MKSKKDIMKKWKPIIDGMGLSGSHSNWLSEYAEMHSRGKLLDWSTTSTSVEIEDESIYSFPSLLPFSMKVAAQTIGMDLVSVRPMNYTSDRKERRIRKIESILEKIKT